MDGLEAQRAIGLVKRLAKVRKLDETPGYKEEGTSYENAEDLQVAADALDEFIDAARRIMSESEA